MQAQSRKKKLKRGIHKVNVRMRKFILMEEKVFELKSTCSE